MTSHIKIQLFKPLVRHNNRQVNEGDMMEALFDEKWYPGKVVDITNQRLKLYFEDDKTTHYYASNIRFLD